MSSEACTLASFFAALNLTLVADVAIRVLGKVGMVVLWRWLRVVCVVYWLVGASLGSAPAKCKLPGPSELLGRLFFLLSLDDVEGG